MVLTGPRPIGRWGLTAVALTALGGPLALAALYAPQMVAGADGSAGALAVAGAVVFAFPLYVWIRFARHEASSGGLYGYVRTAAGAPVAYVQAGLWLVSYALYLTYTTEYVVYDVLTDVFPGIGGARPWLEVGIPIAVAGVILAGRRVAIAVAGVIAAGQLVLLVILAAVTLGHDAPASSFHPSGPTGPLTTAAAGIGLLFVCGSLPLYFGGETARATRTIPRALLVAYAVTAVGVIVATFPYAANPAFTRAAIPGVSVAQVFGGHRVAVAIGVGVAVSIIGVMLVEYLAVTRLAHALTGRSVRLFTVVVAAVVIVSGPISLIDPDGFYDTLIRPSLIALWLSQLIPVAVFPWFARRSGRLRPGDIAITVVALAVIGYGLYGSMAHQISS
jgi:amino acid transporter